MLRPSKNWQLERACQHAQLQELFRQRLDLLFPQQCVCYGKLSIQRLRTLEVMVMSAPWNAFADYGGNNGNFGLLPTVLAAPAAARKVVEESGLQNLVGVGLTMEGIHTNWVINEALLEQGWRFTPQNDTSSWYEDWVSSFSRRRYGSSDPMLVQAWHILANRSEVSVYNGPRGHYFGRVRVPQRQPGHC